MTPEAQRIAIAEFCGWESTYSAGLAWHSGLKRACIIPGTKVHEARLKMKLPCDPGVDTYPDYLKDLNAMHEAEKLLDQGQRTRYIYWLRHGVKAESFGENYFATAAQRAEALLRAIGKWIE